MNPIIHQHDRLRLIIAVIGLVLLSCLSLMLGSTFISPSMLWSYIMNPMESPDQFTIEVLRLPRLVLALVAGAALGISGLLLQNVLKNPIASPDIIGVTGGATLGAVLFIAFVSGISIHFLPVFTLMGAGVATFILMAFQKRGNLQPTTLIIIGIALQTLFMALVSGLLVTTSQLSASKAYLWLVGSLSGATFLDSLIILGCFILMLPLLFLIVPRLNIATMTDEVATGLGLNVNQTKRFEMMVTAVLTAAAISFVGNIGFVGLIAPHIAKTIIKGSYFKKLLMSAIVGGASLVLADLMGRLLFLPKEVPAGVFIAAFGAPFFIYLLLTVKKI
ncbi:iron chelate uptake ABC transporter family permease subunit [Staphylococcus chromogenes]|uniref:FecCD family ABC transporter permease n=1 Tax=Staphylococcus chromogenes TaxID=46126 RepID=UPI0014051D3A|nr:iron ABC transporter permease [Staphylococcus chromogenes]QIN25576.1 iron chelate uptake ABC transporter family permease subunit [Staphylococcus chromogenes]